MKKQVSIAAALLVVGSFVVGSARGQAGSPGIKVNVPFQFAIGGKTLSAGEYKVYSSSEKVWVQEKSGRNVAVLFTSALDGKLPARDGQVIFNCYFNECFLSQVWIAGQEAGRKLPDTKREIQLAKKRAGQEYALLGKATVR
jgi:frataxin-like iron-binding protein CyaY